MTRYVMNLNGPSDRQRAARYVAAAPVGTQVQFKANRRTSDQNSKMWAMLTDLAEQLPWHGVKLRPDDWKFLFLDALKQEMRMVPNIEGNGFVNLGRSSSDLTKQEMSDLIEIIHEFGARHDVKFNDALSSGETGRQGEAT
jgi:hypothetical protein